MWRAADDISESHCIVASGKTAPDGREAAKATIEMASRTADSEAAACTRWELHQLSKGRQQRINLMKGIYSKYRMRAAKYKNFQVAPHRRFRVEAVGLWTAADGERAAEGVTE